MKMWKKIRNFAFYIRTKISTFTFLKGFAFLRIIMAVPDTDLVYTHNNMQLNMCTIYTMRTHT